MGRNSKPANRHKRAGSHMATHFTGKKRGKPVQRKSTHRAREAHRKPHVNRY